jgi:enediyne biosynthesis protein E4
MGNDAGDINNDGLIDVIVLDMLPEEPDIRKQSGGEDEDDVYNIKLEFGYAHQFVRNTLHLNLGGGMFSEIGRLAGIFSTDWSWSPLLCDVDNDGFKDLFITTGIYRRSNDLDYVSFLTKNDFFEAEHNKNAPDKVLYEKMPLYPQFNYIYRNNGDLTFTNMAGEWGFNTRSYSNGSAYADLDNDGDLDLITNNINEHAYIYRNNASERTDANFLSVSLKGSGLNSHAIGTRITLHYKDQKQLSEYFPTRGFMSSSSGDLHFGLGQVEMVDSLIVRWPDLSEQVIENVAAGQRIILDHNNATFPGEKNPGINADTKLVSQTSLPGLDYRHSENHFANFNHEQLVPHNLFAEGPALLVADLNGDGLEDVLAGSAKDQPSAIFLQQDDGSFKQTIVPAFIMDLLTETTDAAAFDADGDGDTDLYLVRGGSEVSQGNPLLGDRLLINDGTGRFTESENGALPAVAYNGSCVAPCDFDNDGDIDLFVGTRSVPGAYGLSPRQLLLENDGHGNFRDVTEERMEKMLKAGMVTDACWIDYDNDGDKDLILVGEWMKVTVLNNKNGYFTDVTDKSGLGETAGFWSSIHAADIDQDGNMDLIAGNIGLNNIFKTSVKEPVVMYINDFDKNGTLDQVICSYLDGTSYPIAMLDQLEDQMPGFKKQFPAYTDFGGKTAREIFGWKALNTAIKKKAVLSESCIFLNNGDGTFKTIKLPVTTQFSPVRDILTHDLNGDGKTDIVLTGNDYTVKPVYGRHDASYGWCLINEGDNNFKTLMPAESGFVVKGDARKIAQITVSGKMYLLVGVNNNDLQVFECLE